jgi:hypothetical protein
MAERRREAARIGREAWAEMLVDTTPVKPGSVVTLGDIARFKHASATSQALRSRGLRLKRERLTKAGVL